MRTIHILGILVLLALAVPASPAHAGGVVTVCDEAHLLAALGGGGTVTFACSGTITLTAEIVIAAVTTIDGSGQAVTISGNNAVRVFIVNEGVTLNLNGITVAYGSALVGGGIVNNGTLTVNHSTVYGNSGGYYGGAGGILNNGTLIVTNSAISGNSSGFGGDGGGISNGGTLIVNNSTVSGNYAGIGGAGAGISNSGTLTVSNSTFLDNWAQGSGGNIAYGGGILNGLGGTLSVSNSTFSGNRAGYGGGIYNGGRSTLIVINSTFSGNGRDWDGGAIYSQYSMVTLRNTIVANSLPWGNCYGPITDGGGNLSYPDTTCPGINADPLLGPLQNNGGPTETMALGPGSAAIDAGIDAICAAAPVNGRDQRGIARPQGARCDIGAVEHLLPFWKWFPATYAQ